MIGTAGSQAAVAVAQSSTCRGPTPDVAGATEPPPRLTGAAERVDEPHTVADSTRQLNWELPTIMLCPSASGQTRAPNTAKYVEAGRPDVTPIRAIERYIARHHWRLLERLQLPSECQTTGFSYSGSQCICKPRTRFEHSSMDSQGPAGRLPLSRSMPYAAPEGRAE